MQPLRSLRAAKLHARSRPALPIHGRPGRALPLIRKAYATPFPVTNQGVTCAMGTVMGRAGAALHQVETCLGTHIAPEIPSRRQSHETRRSDQRSFEPSERCVRALPG